LVGTVSSAPYVPAIVAGVAAGNLFTRQSKGGNVRTVHTMVAVTIAVVGFALCCGVITDGLTGEQYLQTVRSLAVMAANLERATVS
jgi:hypothetical protein